MREKALGWGCHFSRTDVVIYRQVVRIYSRWRLTAHCTLAIFINDEILFAAAIPNLIYLAVDKADVCKKSLKIYRSDLESASHLGKKRQGVRNVLDY
jgi:hypothetical protein